MWEYAYREMIQRKGRALSVIFGHAFTVIIFIVLMMLLARSEDAIDNVLMSTGTHFIAFKPACCGFPLVLDETNEGFWANGSRSQILSVEEFDKIKHLKSVADVSPFLLYQFKNQIKGNNITLGGFDLESPYAVANTVCSNGDIVAGRFLRSDDINNVLIEESFARAYSLHIDSTIQVLDKKLHVVGIVNAGIRPAKADVYLPISEAGQLVENRLIDKLDGRMNVILVESANAHTHKQAMSEVNAILGNEGLISTYGCFKPAAGAMTINRDVIWLITWMLFVFVVAISLRIQHAFVLERKRDIGILNAIGWSGSMVISLVFRETVIQTILGCLIGSLIAFLIHLFIPFHVITGIGYVPESAVFLTSAMFAVLLTFCAGLISGWFASWLIIKRRPSHNLKFA